MFARQAPIDPPVFLASVFNLEARDALLGEFPDVIWDARAWAGRDPRLTSDFIQQECLRRVRAAKLFVAVIGDNPGSYKAFQSIGTEVTVLEIEIFQALIHGTPAHFLTVPAIETNRHLRGLLRLIEQSDLGVVCRCRNYAEVCVAVTRLLMERDKAEGSWAKRQETRRREPLDLRVTFLRDDFASFADAPDFEIVRRLIAEARNPAVDHAARLALLWAAVRRLCATPFTDGRFLTERPLWEEAMGAWATSAAWYGIHGASPIGRLAAVNTLTKLRRLAAASGAGNVNSVLGGRASEYYSIAKLAPRKRRKKLLLQALCDLSLALGDRPLDPSGLLSIRGSVHLAMWRVREAVADYEAALRQRLDMDHSSGAIGEAQCGLGFAYLWQMRFQPALRLLEQGTQNMAAGQEAGFRIRGLRKLAVAYLVLLRWPSAWRTARLACGLIAMSGTYGQETKVWRRLCSWLLRSEDRGPGPANRSSA
jgi:hypothetical protein